MSKELELSCKLNQVDVYFMGARKHIHDTVSQSLPQVLNYPDPRLHRKGKIVTQVNDEVIQKIIDDMHKILEGYEAGVAATQLSIVNPPRIFVVARSPQDGGCLTFVNPKIISAEGTQVAIESCMSIYPKQISAPVKRAETVIVEALDRYGKSFTMKFQGLWAWVMQHEIDHLDGILYLDRLSPSERVKVEEKIKKLLSSKKSF